MPQPSTILATTALLLAASAAARPVCPTAEGAAAHISGSNAGAEAEAETVVLNERNADANAEGRSSSPTAIIVEGRDAGNTQCVWLWGSEQCSVATGWHCVVM